MSNDQPLVRCLLDGGVTRTFIKKGIADLLNLEIISEKSLVIYLYVNKQSEKQMYNLVEIVLKRRTNPATACIFVYFYLKQEETSLT